MSRLFL